MNINEILSYCDHTLLLQTATRDEIIALCDDALEYKTASVCIPPCYVKLASDYLKGRVKVCFCVSQPFQKIKTGTIGAVYRSGFTTA